MSKLENTFLWGQKKGGGAAPVWGEITGSISDQLDLSEELSLKASLPNANTFLGTNLFNGTVEFDNFAPVCAYNPTSGVHLTNKDYVDTKASLSEINTFKSNNFFEGTLEATNILLVRGSSRFYEVPPIIDRAPTTSKHATNKEYVDSLVINVNITGTQTPIPNFSIMGKQIYASYQSFDSTGDRVIVSGYGGILMSTKVMRQKTNNTWGIVSDNDPANEVYANQANDEIRLNITEKTDYTANVKIYLERG